MKRKTVGTVLCCVSLVVAAFTLTAGSAAHNSPASTPGTLATAVTQSQEQGDLSSLAGTGMATAGVASVEPKTDVFNEVVPLHVAEAMNARIREEQQARRAGKPRPHFPVPAGAPAKPADPSPPTEAARGTMPLAANDMVYFVNHDITGAEVSTTQRLTIMEPTALNLGAAVFYTGNRFAAKSTNGGSTFSYLNPYTFFPSVNGGFCCDQVTAYAPGQDMALWALQYDDDGNTNTLRIARAIGSAGVGANSWIYYDFTPQMVGFANGVWFDYPSMTVAGGSLYVSSNAYLTSNNNNAGNVIMRLPLANIAAGTGFNLTYFNSNIGTERLTEGAGSTIYWAGFSTTTQMRIHRWTEGSGTVNWDNVNLNAFNWLDRDGLAASPDGTNWALRADSRPTGAYVAAGVIGVMWTAKQGTGRPKPYAVHARFNEATRALISQGDIWNNDHAWMYPAVQPNADGHLGGALQIGGAASGLFSYPGTQLWVTDDVTGASNTVGGVFPASAGDDGPNDNAWGDFFSVRPHKTRPRTWVAASHSLVGGGAGSNAVPKYVWFGREHDNPINAAITSPAPFSTLPGASATFTWNTGSYGTGYWLYIGTTGAGSTNLLNENQGTNLSRTVSGLPTNGSTVYVRLWTNLTGVGWEYADYTYIAASPVCVNAAMTSPVNGSTLPGATVPFTWNAGSGNTKYWLYVGTSLGGTQILNQDQGTSLTRTVNGIPTNGLPVYVRLWSLCSNWTYIDYTYNTALSGVTARLTAPAPRSVLAGASDTFTWSAGSGSTQYWLYVGSTSGGSDIWNQNQGTGLTRTVTGIPVDGRRIYLRLWSLSSGVWYYVDYDFTAFGTARARLSSPAEGSVLGGTSATIDWSAGTSSTQYWLYIGTALGAYDLVNQNMGTATTLAASGLPTDRGPVYLRLWSLVSGIWVYNDYVFRAYDGGAIRARLTSPTPESILVGSSHTLAWSAGSGSTQYWIYVGTSRGAYDLLNQNMGTALSVAATGFPVNGSTTYIRLWSLVSGIWVYNDYEYISAP